MANTKYTELLQYVLPEVTGCPDPLVEQQLRSTVIDLCSQSRVWRVFQDPLDVIAGQAEYDIDLPPGTSLVQVISCTVDGAPLAATSTDQLDMSMPRWRTETGTARAFLQLTPETFLLAPVPDASHPAGAHMILAIKPSRAATSFPAWIADQYHDAIVAGTKARLMRQNGRPWANLQQAAIEQGIYERAVASATLAGAGSMVRTEHRTNTEH